MGIIVLNTNQLKIHVIRIKLPPQEAIFHHQSSHYVSVAVIKLKLLISFAIDIWYFLQD